MSKLDGIKDLISTSKGDTKKGLHISEEEGKVLLALMALVLLVVALTVLFTTTANGSTGLSSCKGIILSTQRNSCYSALANETGNASICSFIQPQQGSYKCISAIAQYKGNVSTCSLINKSNGEYGYCITTISSSEGRISYCMMLTGENESVCAYNIASAQMFANISDCNIIVNSSKRSICSGVYYNNLAVNTRNASYCSMLQNSNYNSTDTSTLSAILSENSTSSGFSNIGLLSYLYFNATPSNFCYYELANIDRRQSLCAYTGNTLSQICYEENFSASTSISNASRINYTLSNTNMSTVCSSVPTYAEDLCTYYFIIQKAVEERNASSCYAINNTNYQYSCILSIATKYSNISYCNYITGNSSARLSCRESAGILAGNSSG